ncbi:Predicted membrane protein [Pasteurella testudinis DSM 23072]|uniref:Predicted membrane protein n=1 Tax=Pasteurella testudinis DSM 23072 TaxID=1122938 RepID=A0A1W1V338_9PAST|nr:FUSC family protein [Pasteurella testudinis]SMB87451.1 Predicted membrane protein [Pasteurella testudinis DSM 23072]SUB50547.1 YccS/YhfK family integral membrane protein [Pasteurella testudinis]
MLFAYFSPKNAAPLPDTSPIAANQSWRFVIATAVAVATALCSAQYFGLKNDYWAPMSAFLILRPVAQATLARGINRLIGTLLGCVVATLLIYTFHDSLPILVFFLLLTVASALAMQRAHYGLFSFMVSATIVLLIALGHGDPIATTEHRLIATLLGGGIAITMAKIFRL